ncbi:hypothetical protein NURINAE_00472 [Candidatus Nitrosacidococcus sp. I8]|nr:hypothetical protein NURINAE_00472 [Candidatus Nitrosacidococcus sp. I8]
MHQTDEFDTPEQEIANSALDLDEDGVKIQFSNFYEIDKTEKPTIINDGEIADSPATYGKCYVNGVNVQVLHERIQYMDSHGKLITGSLKDYTKAKVKEHYPSLDQFLTKWHSVDKKQAIIDELMEQGIILDNLKEAIGKEMDLFDMICYTAFDQPPLTRAERAKQVKKRDLFTQYGEQARKVLDALLNKYADEGIESIEDMKILKINPFNQLGTPMEIIHLFGGKPQYLQAIAQLEHALYQVA